ESGRSRGRLEGQTKSVSVSRYFICPSSHCTTLMAEQGLEDPGHRPPAIVRLSVQTAIDGVESCHFGNTRLDAVPEIRPGRCVGFLPAGGWMSGLVDSGGAHGSTICPRGTPGTGRGVCRAAARDRGVAVAWPAVLCGGVPGGDRPAARRRPCRRATKYRG